MKNKKTKIDYKIGEEYYFKFAGSIKKGKFLGEKQLHNESIYYNMFSNERYYPIKKEDIILDYKKEDKK